MSRCATRDGPARVGHHSPILRLYPSSEPRPTPSHAEHAVFSALQRCTLPGVAFHSLRLRTDAGWEGEGDFVIADPALGLLVLEVKGGALELRGGQWFQNGKRLDKAPRSQALGFAKKLIDELQRAGCQPPPWGVACVFPDCEFSAGPTAGDLRELVLGKRDLPYLTDALPAVFTRALPAHVPAPTNRKWLEQLKTLCGETWVPTLQLADRVDDAAERTIALDQRQYQLLELAGDTPRALVEGAAGTGKTLVAMELCRRRAAKGLRTQYLCFTDALAKAVDKQLGATPGLKATSVRQLAVDLLRGSGALIPPPDKRFWDEVSLTAACDALPAEDARPDLVVVDEGQDFEAGDWMLAEQLAGPRGLWVFRDNRQAYWERPMPEGVLQSLGGRFTLPRSYRCPEGLAAFAERYANPNAPAIQPPPDVVRVVRCDDAELLERTRHEVETLLKNGAKPEQIVIVSLSGQTRSALFALPKLGSVPLVHADAPDAGRHVVVETFLRFKGLERPFVIIAELGGKHVTHYETRMHIALTRATVQAIVLAAPATLDHDHALSSL